jgi:hypothetical protein
MATVMAMVPSTTGVAMATARTQGICSGDDDAETCGVGIGVCDGSGVPDATGEWACVMDRVLLGICDLVGEGVMERVVLGVFDLVGLGVMDRVALGVLVG